jgi:hypothetical protein
MNKLVTPLKVILSTGVLVFGYLFLQYNPTLLVVWPFSFLGVLPFGLHLGIMLSAGILVGAIFFSGFGTNILLKRKCRELQRKLNFAEIENANFRKMVVEKNEKDGYQNNISERY